MKFKALQTKGKYKSTDAWINAVYRNNKSVIDEKLGINEYTRITTQTLFRNMVKEYIRNGYSPTRAVDLLSRTTIFTPRAERLANNALQGLRGDPDAFHQFRKLTGWKKKVDPSLFRWDKEQKLYIYGETGITVSFKNSPYRVIVRDTNTP